MTWIFGYGSLVWRPAFEFAERQRAELRGWARRFWQASADHRGVPQRPGRVVTLVPDAGAVTVGVAYRLEPGPAAAIMGALDHRERGGYTREMAPVHLADGRTVEAVVYRGTQANPNYLGPAPMEEIVAQISGAVGPSGPNPEYVLRLHDALAEMGAEDPHVAAIATLLRESM